MSFGRDHRAAETLTRRQCADLLGISEGHFANQIETLTAQGFPPRLPGLGKKELRSRAAVQAWIKAGGNRDLMDRILGAGEADTAAMAQLSAAATLDARLAGGVA